MTPELQQVPEALAAEAPELAEARLRTGVGPHHHAGRLVQHMKTRSQGRLLPSPCPLRTLRSLMFSAGASLQDKALKIMPAQMQTWAGHRARIQAFVTIGDYSGHVHLGVQCSKDKATASCGFIILAKHSLIAVWGGYLGDKI